VLSLLLGRQWPSIRAGPWRVIGAAMLLLVAATAQAFELAVPKLGAVAVMRFYVVDDLGGAYKPDGKASLAQRLARELAAPKPSPPSVVVGAAAVIAALAAASGMKAGEGVTGSHRATHGRTHRREGGQPISAAAGRNGFGSGSTNCGKFRSYSLYRRNAK